MSEELTLDEDGYPTESLLEYVRTYPLIEKGPEELLRVLESNWYFGDWGFEHSGDLLELHTGGWSGNEEMIRALKENFFWNLYWESSRRGGHYYFTDLTKYKYDNR
jgi:hypothetical protein